MVNTVIFLITFLSLSNYFQIFYFLISLISPKIKKVQLKDPDIIHFIKNKTKLNIPEITVLQSEKMYGGITGVCRPSMFLSSKLIDVLTRSELEYVILHESAHYLYKHPLIIGVSQVILAILGSLISASSNLGLTFLIAILTTYTFLVIARTCERYAERFAALNINNPSDMISTVNKFEENWMGKIPNILRIFSWNISFKEKRNFAQETIKNNS